MNKNEFISMLDKNPSLKQDLFIRGFLVTNKKIENLDNFPFYGIWSQNERGGYYFLTHKLTGIHTYTDNNNNVFFLLGHAYNPFTMEYDEDKILSYIAEAYGTDEYIKRINDITGVFVYGDIVDGKISYLVDPSGMQSACSGVIGGSFYLSSHPQLIADICGLEMDNFVKELTQYKWYGRVMGPYLPADLTPFKELKRVVPSIKYYNDEQITHKRFWPLKDIKTAEGKEYEKVIQEAADILRNNMTLVSKKWNHPDRKSVV